MKPKVENLKNNSFEYTDNYSRNYYKSQQNCQHLRTEIRLQPANSPHIAGEYCLDCGKWLRWVSKKEYSKLNQNTDNTRLNGGAA